MQHWYNVYMVIRTGELAIGNPHETKVFAERAIETPAIGKHTSGTNIQYVVYIHTMPDTEVINIAPINWEQERMWARQQERDSK